MCKVTGYALSKNIVGCDDGRPELTWLWIEINEVENGNLNLRADI